MKPLSVFACAIVFLFSSCKKDDPAPTCNLDATGILGNYKLSSLVYKADASTPELDIFFLFEPCQKDDLYIFAPNGAYSIAEGATSCSPSNAETGTWSLSGTQLSVDGEVGVVSNYSCSGFTLTQTDNTTGEVTKAVFVRQ